MLLHPSKWPKNVWTAPNPNKCSIKAQNRGGKTPREQKKKEKKHKTKKGTERRKEQEKKKENQKGKMKKRGVLVEKKRLKKAATQRLDACKDSHTQVVGNS